jgi:hypothetical protein
VNSTPRSTWLSLVSTRETGGKKTGTDFSWDIIAIARDIIRRKWLHKAVCKLAKGGLKRGQSGSFGQNDQQKLQQRATYCGRFPEA